MSHHHQQAPPACEDRRPVNSVYMSALNNRTKHLEPLKIPSYDREGTNSSSGSSDNRSKRHRVAPAYPNGSASLGSLKKNASDRSKRSDKSQEEDGAPLVGREEFTASTKQYLSMRSLKPAEDCGSFVFSDSGSQMSQRFNDTVSMRSLASIGMGSTDGRKMIIRRVPTSPNELMNIVNPPT